MDTNKEARITIRMIQNDTVFMQLGNQKAAVPLDEMFDRWSLMVSRLKEQGAEDIVISAKPHTRRKWNRELSLLATIPGWRWE